MIQEDIQQEIVDKKLIAPRITPEHIDSVINHLQTYYHTFEGTTVTICLLRTKNGFTVTGESACVSIENFDIEIGRKIAFENAKQKIWALEGYLLCEKLSGM